MPGIDACLREAMGLPGARGAAIVDWTSGLALGTAGESPGGDHEATAAETAELARAAAEYSAFAPVVSLREATRRTDRNRAGPAGGTPTDAAQTGSTQTGEAQTGSTQTGEAQTEAQADGTQANGTQADGTQADKGPPVEDLIVTTRTSYHILCFVETTFDSSVFLHLWLDRDTGNLALARLRLQRLAERLVLG
ncbi:hypothetical protein [Streptomyces sp. AK02-01A]|uniref:hypothetical protein n=1 Tax=Streptomyces sp. AK02-01A TaxID=3028648 RepID=UPI0039F67A9C